MQWVDGATTGEWEEMVAERVENHIHRLGGNPNLDPARKLSTPVLAQFEDDKPKSSLSLLRNFLSRRIVIWHLSKKAWASSTPGRRLNSAYYAAERADIFAR